MIIAAILILSAVVITIVMQVLETMPVLDVDLGFLSTVFSMFTTGLKLANTFMFADIVLAMFNFLLASEAVLLVYHAILWVVKKIPMFGVS